MDACTIVLSGPLIRCPLNRPDDSRPCSVIARFSRTEASGTIEMRWASASALGISSSCGTTSFTRPMRSASCASMWSPVSVQRLATFQPQSAAKRKVLLEIMRTSGCANTALSEATLMSHAVWYQSPPPMHQPLMAAMIGLPRRHMCRITSTPSMLTRYHSARNASTLMSGGCLASPSPERSYPELNALPEPVRMITRTCGSLSATSKA